jgi:hypothetical protein
MCACGGTDLRTECHGEDVCDRCVREIREGSDAVDTTLQQTAGGIPAAEGSKRLLRVPPDKAAAAPAPLMQHAASSKAVVSD